MTLDVSNKFVTLQDLNFHYRDWGGEGRATVLVHGLASTCHIWDLVAPLLTDNLRVVALDQRGHGESHKPNEGYDFDTITKDLHAFINKLRLNSPLLVGHSWGGNTVLHYGASFSNSIAGLVLVDGGTIEPSVLPGFTWERTQQELTPPDFTGVTVEDLVQRQAGRARDCLEPQIEAILLANFNISPSRFISPRLKLKNHMQIVRALWEHKPSKMFPQVKCPVLLVPAWSEPVDERMAQFLEMKKTMNNKAQALLPRVKVVNMEDTIHDVPLQRPQELAKAILNFAQELP